MKIRRKGRETDQSLEVLEESPSFYVALDRSLAPVVCEKASWELVKPEPVWVDVTSECEAQEHIVLHDKKMVHGNPCYRLRKVSFDGDCTTYHPPAFIIEKRQA